LYYWGLLKLGVPYNSPIFGDLDDLVSKNYDQLTLQQYGIIFYTFSQFGIPSHKLRDSLSKYLETINDKDFTIA
jgi:hypothetical protein